MRQVSADHVIFPDSGSSLQLPRLAMCCASARFPEEAIAPDRNADKFRHGHILDTMKYAEDCDNVFGCFLHHFPYFGMRGEEDAASQAAAAANMVRLYEQEFGNADTAAAGYCGVVAGKPNKAAAYCGAAINS